MQLESTGSRKCNSCFGLQYAVYRDCLPLPILPNSSRLHVIGRCDFTNTLLNNRLQGATTINIDTITIISYNNVEIRFIIWLCCIRTDKLTAIHRSKVILAQSILLKGEVSKVVKWVRYCVIFFKKKHLTVPKQDSQLLLWLITK